jgi:hypothetical protein
VAPLVWGSTLMLATGEAVMLVLGGVCYLLYLGLSRRPPPAAG